MRLLMPLVMLVFVLQGSVVLAENNHVSMYLQAGELEDAGNYAGAADVIRQMIKTDKSSHLYIKLTELLVVLGQLDQVEQVLTEAEKEFPQDHYFKYALGNFNEFQKKDAASAYKYYENAAKLAPNEPKYKLAMARMLEATAKYKEALAIIDGLIGERPLPIYYSDKGRIYQRMGKRDEAVKNLKIAIDTGEDMSAMLRLADIYLSENNNKEAKKILERITAQGQNLILPELKLGDIYKEEKDYSKAIELYSTIADKLEGRDRAAVLKQMGSILYEMGDYDNASRTFEWVTELTPEDSMSAYFSGYIYEYLGKMDKAREVYSRALSIRPDYAQLLKRMAVIDITEEKGDSAISHLNKINSVERDVDYYLLMAEAYGVKKDNNKAILILIDGLNENPTDTGILYSLASRYEMLGERDKAIDAVKRAIKVDKENPIFQNFLGYVYADIGINLDEAKGLIEFALSKDPLNPAYLDSMAWVLYKLKDYKKALEYMEKAILYTPDDPEMVLHMEAIKEKLKK